jgi:4-hydroxythreonine-4-phosphate dehydrogenase
VGSVDHGTAFDIAGTWKADARGQVNALRVAAELVATKRSGVRVTGSRLAIER